MLNFDRDGDIEISIKDIFQNPSVDNLAKFINKNYKKILIAEKKNKKIIPDTKHLYKPFPLTDVQMAYWIVMFKMLVILIKKKRVR